eukprot:gene11704-4938_t
MSQRKKRGRKAMDSDEDEFTFSEHEEEEENTKKKKRKTKKSVEDDDEEFVTSTQKDSGITSEEKKALISNLIRLFIIKDSKKLPVTKKDIGTYVMTGKKRGVFKDVLSEAKNKLKNIFGFDVVEVVKAEQDDSDVAKIHSSNLKAKQSSNTCWILKISKFENEKEDEIEYRNEQLILDESKPKYGLIMVIVSLIMINDAPLEEEFLWRDLKKLGIDRKKEHIIFGNPEKLIEQFVKELYLLKVTNPGTIESGPSVTYKTGTRITTEIPQKLDVNIS